MSLKDLLMFCMLLAYGNMMQKNGKEQRKYALRLVDASARIMKSIPEGMPIWMVINIGATACANGDMAGTIQHGVIVHIMKQELLQEATRRKARAVLAKYKETVAACN